MAFQGSLAELHLPDIIQLISVSGKTGVFHLTDGSLKGEIFLAEGRIVHAQMERLVGEEAVYALAIWRQGEFLFEPGPASDVQTITKSNTNLLMEAARRLDEWRVLSKKIPSVDLIPEFVVQDNREGQINLNTSEWLILSKIDGTRSVKSIAESSGLSVFDASKMLYGLVATGLIRLKEGDASASKAQQAAASRPPASGSGPQAKATAGTAQAGQSRPPAPATVAPSRPTSSAPQTQSAANELYLKLNRVRDSCAALLGPVGESVVVKHYQKARTELERGAGLEAIEEAVQQVARAAAILKGPGASDAVLELLKGLH